MPLLEPGFDMSTLPPLDPTWMWDVYSRAKEEASAGGKPSVGLFKSRLTAAVPDRFQRANLAARILALDAAIHAGLLSELVELNPQGEWEAHPSVLTAAATVPLTPEGAFVAEPFFDAFVRHVLFP